MNINVKLSRGALSKIHIARQQLGMDDESYRSLLARVAGVRSAKDLNDRQAGAVLKEFERLGFQPKPAKKQRGKPHNFNAQSMPQMITKIEAQLADMQLAWAYADGIAKQMFGIQRVAWVREPKQLKAIIAALHVEQERRGLLAGVNRRMEWLDRAKPEWRDRLPELPAGWERHRPTLKQLLEQLEALVNRYSDEVDIPW